MNHTFSAEVGPHLPTSERWKIESALDRYVMEITVVCCLERHALTENVINYFLQTVRDK